MHNVILCPWCPASISVSAFHFQSHVDGQSDYFKPTERVLHDSAPFESLEAFRELSSA